MINAYIDKDLKLLEVASQYQAWVVAKTQEQIEGMGKYPTIS